MLAICDVDSLIYRVGFTVEYTYYLLYLDGTEHEFRYKKDLTNWLLERELSYEDVEVVPCVEVGECEQAEGAIKFHVKSMLEEVGATRAELYISGNSDLNFRKQLYSQYKANRTAPKPVHFDAIRQVLLKQLGAKAVEGIEPDDKVCMRAWDCIENGYNFVVISEDKDLLQIPGKHYTPSTKKMFEVGNVEADKYFYTQLLVGDTSDNIPGVPGIGKATAGKLLVSCTKESEMYEVCKETWLNKGRTIDDMHLSAKLLYLLRHESDEWIPPT